MHFSIPDTQELKDNHGGTYVGYNIHINGAYHCTVRYRQLHSFNEQLKREYGSTYLPHFPPKKLLPLSPPQLEERRVLLEKYIQMLERRLQNFEAPFLSQKAADSSHCIVIRKSYWDPGYDEDILSNKIALNLLYVQAMSDVEQGWVIANKQTKRQLATLQSKGSKQEYLQLVRTLRHYGYIQFEPCICNYPEPNTQVVISIGGKEINFRIPASNNQVKEGSFRITRIRCWRIITSNTNNQEENSSQHLLELSFEYLLSKDKLQWITVKSDQAVLMSVCLQGMVEELLSKRNGLKFKKQSEQGSRHCSWSYMKRDGSSYEISVSRSSSSEGIVDNEEDYSRRLNKSRDHVRKEKFSSYFVKPSGRSSSGSLSPESLMENDVFEGIGDDDL
ncbi:sorting nexin-17-like isoform X4 [Tachypleus tridentatus]|uniref:sorting nexin-17-like isoform X4 n=1 Tax=Tachypleus tridentatus TaxID=6853 RepID=UPI003FD0F92A